MSNVIGNGEKSTAGNMMGSSSVWSERPALTRKVVGPNPTSPAYAPVAERIGGSLRNCSMHVRVVLGVLSRGDREARLRFATPLHVGSIPTCDSKCVGWAMASLTGCKPVAFGL